MRIGIFGGSFNPIHNGHIGIAKNVIDKQLVDKCLLVVSNKPPHKELAFNVSPKCRFDMTLAALQMLPNYPIYACNVEICNGLSYTVDTLEELHNSADFAYDDFYLIVGADMLVNFASWFNPQRICQLISGIIAVYRSTDVSDSEYRDACDIIEHRFGFTNIIAVEDQSELSSTIIRNNVNSFLPIAGMVPYGVERMIYENALYARPQIVTITEDLHRCLTPKRFVHSVSTMREAILLSDRYNVPPEKCALAALVHDCAKVAGVDYITLAHQQGLAPDRFEQTTPALLHGKLGEYKARNQYNIHDNDILESILLHTICSSNMSVVGNIVYVADKIEALRDYPEVDKLRRIAYEDLDEGLFACLSSTIDKLAMNGKPIHTASFKARDEIAARIRARK